MALHFPHIDYNHWLDLWNQDIGEQKIYTNKNTRADINPNWTSNECERRISELVLSPKDEDSHILKVLDFVYAWGGWSGRIFGSKGPESKRQKLQDSEKLMSFYREGIRLAKVGSPSSIDSFIEIPGIGISFGTKLAYFWSLAADTPLVIVDSKIAGALGHKSPDRIPATYKEVMNQFQAKSKEEFGREDPVALERALFMFHSYYFKNDNSGWSRNPDETDLTEAKRLAEMLF